MPYEMFAYILRDLIRVENVSSMLRLLDRSYSVVTVFFGKNLLVHIIFLWRLFLWVSEKTVIKLINLNETIKYHMYLYTE